MRQEGWHLALEHQLEALKWTMEYPDYLPDFYDSFFQRQDEPEKAELPEWAAEEAPKYSILTRQMLYRGDTIYITRDMEHLLLQAAHDLPDDVTCDVRQVLTPIGFLYLADSIEGQDTNEELITFRALGWSVEPVMDRDNPGHTKLCVHTFWFSDDQMNLNHEKFRNASRRNNVWIPNLLLAHYYPIYDAERLTPEDMLGDARAELTKACVKLFWAFQLLSQQKIVSTQRMNPPRSTRRRHGAPKEGWRYISLITLRRKSAKKDGDEEKKIDWTHRWVVEGHWRKQWYPKLGIHQWKYIHEYVKGPEDKPLWVRERRVFNFRR